MKTIILASGLFAVFIGLLACLHQLRIEQALGQRTSETLTAEFHQAAVVDQHLRQQG